MSYPGYPPYQQDSSPYPRQEHGAPPCPQGSAPGYPQGGSVPYPQGGSAPYPQQQPGYYPPQPQPGVYPPSLGYGVGAPMYMPQPYGGINSSYPPPPTQTGGYYPPQAPPTGYPSHSQSVTQSHYNPSAAAATTNYGNYKSKKSPTVTPAHPFNPREDAEILRKAMKGFGTDEKAIINVLCHRTNVQRLEIAVQFKTLYGKDLIKDLKSELSGNFENLILSMMTPLPQFYAQELYDAISGIGTDEDTLIEVLCTLSNNEIKTIRHAYRQNYGRDLESDLKGDTGGTFKRLMVSLCNANRDESMHADPHNASADAQALLRAGELRLGTDESTFNMILCQRNYEHLKLVFNEYQRLTGHDIEKAVKSEFSGDAEEGLLAVIRSVRNQSQFFAKRLHQSMAGVGTNDRQLIRLVVTRCEIDMGDIKREYHAKYGKALADAIKDDTSGDYKKGLLALIGEY